MIPVRGEMERLEVYGAYCVNIQILGIMHLMFIAMPKCKHCTIMLVGWIKLNVNRKYPHHSYVCAAGYKLCVMLYCVL